MRLWNVFAIGQVTQVDDSADIQRIQLTERALGTGGSDRITDKVRRILDFGFTSNPPLDSQVVVLRHNGDRVQPLAMRTSHRPSRIKNLQPGDVAVYDVRGALIKFTSSGILIDGAGLDMTIQNVGTVTIDGDLKVTGEVTAHSDGGTPISLTTHIHSGVANGSDHSGPPSS